MEQTLTIKARRAREFPRTLTRAVTDFGDWDQLEPLFRQLADEMPSVQTAEQLSAWLLAQSELDAAIDEEIARRYIAMTCQTDDPEREKAYLHCVENVLPRVKTWHDRMARLYLANPARERADRRWLEVHDRVAENQVKLFREANVALQTEDTKLSTEYQKVIGAMLVQWEGEEKTLQQMAPYLEETDRPTREAAWRLVAERRFEDTERLNELFDRMVPLRDRIARNAEFDSYRDYRHQAYDRFDYTPADCVKFQESIEQEVVPLLAELRRRRREQLGVEALRPWDLQVDPEGKPPLHPFATADELSDGCAEIFAGLDPRLAGHFATMREQGLLDLESRKGKAPGGYQYTLDEVRLPFIFMNAAGTNRDVLTLLHEGGHAFHAMGSRDQSLLAYRSAPTEFSEVASMAMELFGMSRIEVFYQDPDQARRARRRHLREMITLFPWIATVDAFQHWIYLNPDHSAEQRDDRWVELNERFSPELDHSGLENLHRAGWHRQLHIYQCPFYYVEYGIAQLGALQLWLRFREEPTRALEDYLAALALGGSRPLPELFETAGIHFDFSPQTLRPIMQAVGEELERLG